MDKEEPVVLSEAYHQGAIELLSCHISEGLISPVIVYRML